MTQHDVVCKIMPTPERMNKRKGAQDMKKLMEILGDKRELCRLLNEHKDMLMGIVVLVIVLGLVVSAVKTVDRKKPRHRRRRWPQKKKRLR